MKLLAVLAALVLGAATGWLCRQIPVRPIAQDLAAAVIGWAVGSIAMVAWTLLTWRLPETGGLGIVSFGLSEAIVFGIPAVILLAVVGRLALRRLGAVGSEMLGTHASIFLGGAAALLGALWMARGMVVSSAS